jgi:hypothetical protein
MKRLSFLDRYLTVWMSGSPGLVDGLNGANILKINPHKIYNKGGNQHGK